MSSEKYPVGAKLEWPGESKGVVVENFKMPGDICVKWDVMDEPCSYDEWFLDKHVFTLAEGFLLPSRSSQKGVSKDE